MLTKAQLPRVSLIINEWKLKSYTVNGKPVHLSEVQKESRHIFYRDQTCKSIDDRVETPGTWTWDPKRNSIIISNDLHPHIKTVLKIERITPKQMTVTLQEKNYIVITMTAVN